MPRVERARLMERPALDRVRRMSSRRSKISTANPLCRRRIASNGPFSPAPINVMRSDVGFIGEIGRENHDVHNAATKEQRKLYSVSKVLASHSSGKNFLSKVS